MSTVRERENKKPKFSRLDIPYTFSTLLTTPIIKIKGDRVTAIKWLSKARALLNELVTYMRLHRLDQARRVLRPQPGVLIEYSKAFNITRILIAVSGGTKEVVEEIFKWYWYSFLTGGTLKYLMDIGVDSTQGVWVVGGYSASLTPGTTFGDDVLIAKYDTDGELLISKTIIEQTKFEFATSLCINSNTLYMTVDHYSSRDDTYYDSALVKFNTSGEVSWSTKIGLASTSTYHTDAQVGSSGIFTCGWVQDEVQVASLGANSVRWIGFVNKFSAAGVLLWKRILYYSYTVAPPLPDGHIKIERMTLDSNDNSYAIGLDMGDSNWISASLGAGQGTIFKLNSSGVLQWEKQVYSVVDTVSGDSFWVVYIEADSSDGLYMLCVHADVTDSLNGNFIYYLVKLNVLGVIQWQRTITVPYSNGEGNYIAYSFPATYPRLAIRQNNVYMFTDAYDVLEGYLVFKFSTDGTLVWQRGIETLEFGISLSRMAIDQDGDILFTGDTTVSLQGFTMKLPGSGGFLGRHKNIRFSDPELVIDTSGVGIRDADNAGLLFNGTTLYNTWVGTYETEDIELAGDLSKILVEKTIKRRSV